MLNFLKKLLDYKIEFTFEKNKPMKKRQGDMLRHDTYENKYFEEPEKIRTKTNNKRKTSVADSVYRGKPKNRS